MKRGMRFGFVGVLALILVPGCVVTPPPKPVAYTPQFTLTKTIEKQPGAEGISIALVRPMYGPELAGQAKLFETIDLFRQSLAKETETMLVAKGFKLLGPFSDLSEMTFPQKKQSDLILQPIMAFSIESPQPQMQSVTNWTAVALGLKDHTQMVPSWTGPCSLSGFVSFEVLEPLSSQKMWMKKVNLETMQEDCSADDPDSYNVKSHSAIGRMLEQAYNQAMEKADTYFNGEEMQLVKRQSAELREKKVY